MQTYHIPNKIGNPVKVRLNSTDKLHMFGLANTFLNKKDYKASRNEGHSKNNTDGHQYIHRGCYPKKQVCNI